MLSLRIPNINKGVIFVVKGPFAHFRKFYSQTSALSYSVPPRTALSGIVGAILGIPRSEVYKLMQPPNGFFALQLLTPIRKITVTTNLLATKKEYLRHLLKKCHLKFFDSAKNRTQIPFEILVPQPPDINLKFKVIFWHQDKSLLDKLAKQLIKKQTFFPIYLGISEFLASVKFDGFTESAVELKEYEGEIHSVVVSKNVLKEGLIKPGNKFNVEYMLIYMNNDFSAKDHVNVIYSEQAESLNLKVKYALKSQNFVWTPYELMI